MELRGVACVNTFVIQIINSHDSMSKIIYICGCGTPACAQGGVGVHNARG